MRFSHDAWTIAPGPARSPIREKGGSARYAGFTNSRYLLALMKLRAMLARMSRNGLPSDRIATFAHQAFTNAKPKARMVASPQPIKTWIDGCLPRRCMDGIIAKQLGLGVVPCD